MKGLMMNYPLTTNVIIEYGNRVFPYKEITSKLPNGTIHRYTYADMYSRTKKLAHALVNKLGVKKGDRVSTFAWNHYQHIELYYAIPGAGAVCHTLNLRLSVEQIAFIINHAEDNIIFFDATVAPLIEKAAANAKTVKHYVVINAAPDFKSTLPNVIHYEDLLASGQENFEWVEVDENDACGLCYTSGTTGEPKGALYSHRSTYLHAVTILTGNASAVSSRDKVLLIVPQFHVMAWGYPYMCVMAGADMVLPSLHLQPDALINLLQTENITYANGVPTIWMGVYDTLKKNPPQEKLKLREFTVGGSAIATSLIDGFEKDFGIKAVQAWGMTETSPLGTVAKLQPEHDDLPYEEQLKIRGKQGFELPGVEIRAVDDNGNILPRDGVSVGEIEIRGAWIINSYYKLKDNSERFSKDGWFKTGDVATIDKYGFMNITDRTKDLIKSGGEWISSVALETAIFAHPKVKEAAVIAIPDEKWMERPLACIVLQDKETLTIEELKQFLSKDFAGYQLPDKIAIIPDVPKTSVGKFDKKVLRQMYADGKLK